MEQYFEITRRCNIDGTPGGFQTFDLQAEVKTGITECPVKGKTIFVRARAINFAVSKALSNISLFCEDPCSLCGARATIMSFDAHEVSRQSFNVVKARGEQVIE